MAIDGSKIIHAVMEGSRIREAKGILPLFGVYLSLFSVHYYNRLSFDFEKMLGKDRSTEAESLLIKAAQECGYATFQGIRNSWEWEEIVELIPDQKLVIHVSDSYEANGYLESYGLSGSGKCYMLRGVAGAFMDLIYGEDYPEGCFDFLAEEPLCRAKGDHYCEFISRRSSH